MLLTIRFFLDVFFWFSTFVTSWSQNAWFWEYFFDLFCVLFPDRLDILGYSPAQVELETERQKAQQAHDQASTSQVK